MNLIAEAQQLIWRERNQIVSCRQLIEAKLSPAASTLTLGVASVDRVHGKNYRGRVKVRDLVKLIERDGWYWVRTKGSHHQYKHPTKPGLITIPGKPGNDMAIGTLNNILKQAGLKA